VTAEPHGREDRYRLLETTRQYAREKLLDSGEAEDVRQRHFDFFRRLAEDADPRLRGPEVLIRLRRLEAEHDNFRAVLALRLEGGEAGAGLQLAGMLWWFWFLHGYLSEGRRWLEALLAASRSASAPPRRG